MGPYPTEDELDPELINAGRRPSPGPAGRVVLRLVAVVGMIRGGQVDVAVLGAMQVSARGDLANWMIPATWSRAWAVRWTSSIPAQAGDRDEEHVSKKGESKILDECTLPLTGKGCVQRIITDMAVLDVTDEGLRLVETAPGIGVDDVVAATAAKLLV